MDAREFEVEVVYRQRAIYRVEAPDRETAERLAAERWQQREPSAVAGYDWSELESVQAYEAAERWRREQDVELVLRFLRERERLILRLGGQTQSPSTNDAISADQVAADLGWGRRARTGASVPDVPRATEALEALCEQRRAVCFQRPRVRTGERGEIRLYCTAEYLDRLSSMHDGAERQAS